MNNSFRIGFTSVTFRSKTPGEICKIATDNGIRFIEWGADVHVTDGTSAEYVRKLCDEAGITSVSLGSYYRVGDGKPEDFEKDCKSAQILGCKRIRVWLGKKSSVDTSSEEKEKLISEVRKLAKIAEKYGLTLAFEFHKKTYNDSGLISAEFIRRCGRENILTYWQPFSFGADSENLRAALPYLSAVHIFSWDENNTRYPLSYKRAEWEKYCACVIKNKSACDFIIEFVKDDSAEAFSEDVLILKSIIEKAKEEI